MNKSTKQKGFTLVELLIVMAVIGILAAIAVPGYLGMQERSRKGSVTKSVAASEPEVQAWLHSAQRGLANGTGSLGQLFEVDTNANGAVSNDDMNNYDLGQAIANLCSMYVSTKQALQPEMSPWAATAGSLWINGAADSGKISCSVTSNANAYSIVITAQDASGQMIHQKYIYTD